MAQRDSQLANGTTHGVGRSAIRPNDCTFARDSIITIQILRVEMRKLRGQLPPFSFYERASLAV